MENKENKVTNDFLNNENPFIFSTDNNTPNPKIEVIQALQPTFIPYALNQDELKLNFRRFLDANMDNLISDIINEYCYKNQLPQLTEQALIDCNNFTNEDLMDAIIKIKSLKLWNKQQQLREKVHDGLINSMKENQKAKAYSTKIPNEEDDLITVNEIIKKCERQKEKENKKTN